MTYIHAKPGQCYIAGNGAVVHVFKVGDASCECTRRMYAADIPYAHHFAQKCDHKFVDSDSCLKCGWTP